MAAASLVPDGDPVEIMIDQLDFLLDHREFSHKARVEKCPACQRYEEMEYVLLRPFN